MISFTTDASHKMFPIIERAYQLAASGRFDSMSTIQQRLKSEGYSNAEIATNLDGRGTRHALMKLYGAALQGADYQGCPGSARDGDGIPKRIAELQHRGAALTKAAK